MSEYTRDWTKEKLREIIRKLDEKTGLNGATLDIVLFKGGRRLGYYRKGKEKLFGFNIKFFNDPTTKEAEVVEIIRHEYAHYYDDVAMLDKYIVRSPREKVHGADWKWACKMVGSNAKRIHDFSAFKDIKWSMEEAEAKYNAEDVRAFDIQQYLNRWNEIPLDEEKERRILERIKEKNPEGYYGIGQIVLHPARGFGVVLDTIPCVNMMQKIYVQFDDKTDGVFRSDELWREVEGVAVLYTQGRI